jgi:L-iditol 2-dehydrogenase
MRSIQLVAPRILEPREMAMPPDPGPGEVMVRVRAVGICGSDLHWFLEGGIAEHRPTLPQVLGHEPSGVIEAVGAGVHHLRPGQKVAVEPTITCGACESCLAGRHNQCAHSRTMGTHQLPGLFREFATMPAHNAVAVPEAMSFDEATVIEPLAVILHVLELTRIGLGATVAVLGAGPIGLLTAMAARQCGASRVFVTDRVPHRLRFAADAGADATIDITRESAVEVVMDHTRGRGVDLVFDCAASPDTLNQGVQMARPGGRVVLIGLPSTARIHFDLWAAMIKELDIQTVRRSNCNAEAAIALLTAGRIPLGFVTHHYPLEQTPRAFDTLTMYADGIGKAIIEIP